MLYDDLQNLGLYTGLSQNLDIAIEWIASHDLDSLPEGKTAIRGEDIYVNVMQADPRPEEELRFELHHKYIDLQLDLAGSELFQVCLSAPEQEPSYDAQADVAFFDGAASAAGVLGEGRFVVFFAGEAHKPTIRAAGADHVKKAVFKILAE